VRSAELALTIQSVYGRGVGVGILPFQANSAGASVHFDVRRERPSSTKLGGRKWPMRLSTSFLAARRSNTRHQLQRCIQIEKPCQKARSSTRPGRPQGGWTIVAVHDSKESWEHFRDGILMPQMKKGIMGALVQIAGAGKRPVLYCRDFKLGARHSTLQAQVDLGHPDVPVRIVPCGCDASIRYRRS
jgi:hypothetical protein